MFTKLLCGSLFVASLAFANTGLAAEKTPLSRLLSSEQARTQDARKIAAATGLSVADATRRLELQHETADLGKSLRDTYRNRLAGIYREWTPTPRFVVRLKGQGPERTRFYTYQGQAFEVTFLPGASHTLAELESARKHHADAIHAAFPSLQATSIDERAGELVLTVLDGDGQALAARATAIAGVPTRVETGEATKQLSITGSGEIDIGTVQADCTGGFAVRNNAGTASGIVTAGHCGNATPVNYFTIDALSTPLSFAAEAWNGSSDVQWYTGTATFVPQFSPDGGTFRDVYGNYWLANTFVGDALCFFGTQSGQQCGVVDSLAYAPNPPGGCNGQVCQAAFVSVTGANLQCNPGDSGGPVFRDEYAYGVLSGGSFNQSTGKCTRFFYSPLDALDALDIYVMVAF